MRFAIKRATFKLGLYFTSLAAASFFVIYQSIHRPDRFIQTKVSRLKHFTCFFDRFLHIAENIDQNERVRDEENHNIDWITDCFYGTISIA